MKNLTKIPHVREITTEEKPCPKFGCHGTLGPCIYGGHEVMGCDECDFFEELPPYNNLSNETNSRRT